MTDRNSSHKLNEFGTTDYKKPLGKQQDMRTSTYMAHKFMDDTMLGNLTQAKYKETISYAEDPILEKHRTTNYKSNYEWKFGNPDEVRNVSLDRKIHYIKPFYDCNLKFLKRTMRPLSSVSHSDYLMQPEAPVLPSLLPRVPAAVSSTKVVIERNKPGYSKYLDAAATTNRLDYCYRSPTDVMNGIAANDHITFWNWKDIKYSEKKVFRTKDEQLCDQVPATGCNKRRCEFTSTVKAVPNSGLTTEVRENYVQPNQRAHILDARHIKNDLTFVASEPVVETTEYGMLGSRECTQKYV